MARQLKKKPAVEVDTFDTLSVGDSSVKGVQKRAIEAFNAVPLLPKMAFDLAHAGHPLVSWATTAMAMVKAAFSEASLEHIRDYDPDLIVSTQAEAGALLSHWKRQGEIEAPIHSISTDHLGDVRWAHDQIEHYYVGNEMMVDDLKRCGVPPEKITVTGLPTREEFGQPVADPKQLRNELGLDPEELTVLISGGGLGSQPYAELAQAFRDYRGIRLVCITAKNEQAKEDLDALELGHVTALGFVDNMSDWVKASDVVVAKPGGLSTAELLAAGKPMLIHNPYPGMEQAQAARLEDMGVGFQCLDPYHVAYTVDGLMTNEEERKKTSAKVAAHGKPNAASDIADLVIERARAYQSSRQEVALS